MIEIEVHDREVIALMQDHFEQDAPHTNLKVGYCSCNPLNDPNIARKPPAHTGMLNGGICFNCGGMTVQTGSCTECTQCFTSSGGCG